MDEFIDPEYTSRKRLLELNSAQIYITRDIRKIGDNHQKRRRIAAHGGFTAREATFALHLYDVAGCSLTSAVFYLTQQLQSKHHVNTLTYDAAELGRMIEDWFLALDDVGVTALSVSDRPTVKRCIARAAKFHDEHKLRLWVAEQNVLKGLAPSTSSMALQCDSLDLDGPVDVELARALRFDVMMSRNRMWAFRFRRRWGMTYQKIPSRDNLSNEDIHAKAESKTKLDFTFCFNMNLFVSFV